MLVTSVWTWTNLETSRSPGRASSAPSGSAARNCGMDMHACTTRGSAVEEKQEGNGTSFNSDGRRRSMETPAQREATKAKGKILQLCN